MQYTVISLSQKIVDIFSSLSGLSPSSWIQNPIVYEKKGSKFTVIPRTFYKEFARKGALGCSLSLTFEEEPGKNTLSVTPSVGFFVHRNDEDCGDDLCDNITFARTVFSNNETDEEVERILTAVFSDITDFFKPFLIAETPREAYKADLSFEGCPAEEAGSV